MCSTDCEGCRKLRTALVDSLGEQGLGLTTIEEVAARCGLEDEVRNHRCGALMTCALEAYREESERLYELAELGFCGREAWLERYRGVLAEVIEVFIARPGVMRLCLAEVDCASIPGMLAQRAAGRERWVALLAREHDRSPETRPLPPVYFEMLAGAAYHMLQREFLAGRPEGLRRVPSQIDRFVPAFEPMAA
jgi:hypothetical protein